MGFGPEPGKGESWAVTVGGVRADLRVEIDGRRPTVEELAFPALVNYGHFTAMQVRNWGVRGLRLHLARLEAATRELFGEGLDGARVRDHVRHALGSVGDASVRVAVFRPDGVARPSVLVAVRPAQDPPATPQRLQSAAYQRPAAHLKHVGTFGQIYLAGLAAHAGFDDVLLVDRDGVVAEGGITNVAFFDGAGVVWPNAPALDGITMQLVEAGLPATGLPSRRGRVSLKDLPSFRGGFVTNSLGIAPIGRVDDIDFPLDSDVMRTVTQVHAAVGWDPI